MSAPGPTPAGAGPAYANPALIGLLGFIFATTIANLHNVGLTGADATVWVGAIFGGLVQMIAGFYHFRLGPGETMSMTVFVAYGAFWIITPVFSIAAAVKLLPVESTSVGAWLLMWAALSLLFMIAALWANKTLALVLAFVWTGLLGLAVGVLAKSDVATRVGGALLLGSAAVACWLLVSGLLNAQAGTSLTTGEPLLQRRQ